jgi:adenylate cyclase
MAPKKNRSKLFETKYFGMLIGVMVILFFLALEMFTLIPERLELKILDLHFNLKNVVKGKSVQEGVTLESRNPNISPDILIVGVDFSSLSRFGKWPFPRYRHANLLDSFSRISDQGERESAVFLDFFFIEPDSRAFDDAILTESIRNHGKVYLETVLEINSPPAGLENEFFGRQKALYESFGEIIAIQGEWSKIPPYFGLQPPLKPYGTSGRGYGHANFVEDYDKIFRRQALIARSSELLDIIPLDDVGPDYPLDRNRFEWLGWIDRDGLEHTFPYPMTSSILEKIKNDMEAKAPQKAEDTNNDGKPDKFYHVVRKYRDHFVPSITLSLALNYFNKKYSDLEVILGRHIRIPSPQFFDIKKQEWVPYKLEITAPQYDAQGKEIKPGNYRVMDEILIPIDSSGEMLVNFMGIPSTASPDGHQTFPVRSYAVYASRVPGPDPSTWPRTKAVANKILMVGPFTEGMAADQKPTPYGLMYGVEIHANALNTILMNKFLNYAPVWMNYIIFAVMVLFIAFISSRLSPIWSFAAAVFIIFAYFLVTTFIFDEMAFILNFSSPGIGVFLSFLSVVVYRAMTEEKDKRRIKDMFGKYVSPKVVDQILAQPLELGGVDKEITVFFSDIRGFTTLSESMTPQELVNHLNLYLTAMTDIILDYRGTLDKYVGDEIMCFWGAPLPQPDHAILSCKCALKQMQVLGELNAEWPPEKRIDIGIGLNSGIMTVGNMGSMGRMNYTLMGDNVNLGARLEGTNKQYQTHIIISEYTYGLVKDRVIARELDNIRVKGKNRPVLIYELIDVIEGLDVPEEVTGNSKKKQTKK